MPTRPWGPQRESPLVIRRLRYLSGGVGEPLCGLRLPSQDPEVSRRGNGTGNLEKTFGQDAGSASHPPACLTLDGGRG